jgi:hypothetical protein
LKLLVAIMTCHRLDYYIDDLTVDWCTQQGLRCTDQQARVTTIRETWVPQLPGDVDFKFFYGTRLRQENTRRRAPLPALREPLSDEIFLECGDNYTENPAKMKAICRWALARGYDYILRCDDDTYIYPDRLLIKDRAMWDGFDYAGASVQHFHPGGCMFLSRKMMELVIAAPVTNYADDVWIGQVAQDNRIPMTTVTTMRNQWGTGYKVPADVDPTGLASFHSCTPDIMRKLYVAGSPTTPSMSPGTSTPAVS